MATSATLANSPIALVSSWPSAVSVCNLFTSPIFPSLVEKGNVLGAEPVHFYLMKQR